MFAASIRCTAAVAFLVLVGLGAQGALGQSANDVRRPNYDHETIEDFVQNAYLMEWFSEGRHVRRHFADPVANYWGKREVRLRDVIRDKEAYAQRWPSRHYRLNRASLRIRQVPERAGTYDVVFEYAFDARNRSKRSCGIGETDLTLRLLGDEIIIIAEGGRVLRRGC